MSSLIDLERLNYRTATCGHTVIKTALVHDSYYADTLCPDCAKIRQSRLKYAGSMTGNLGVLQDWQDTMEPEIVWPDNVQHVIDNPTYVANYNDTDIGDVYSKLLDLPDSYKRLRLDVTRDKDKLHVSVLDSSVDVNITRNIDGEYILDDAAYTEALPSIMQYWIMSVEKSLQYPALLDDLPDAFITNSVSNVAYKLLQVANSSSGKDTMYVDILPISMKLHTAAVNMSPEQVIALLMPSVTILEGRSAESDWSGTCWRATHKHFVTCAHVVNPKNTPGYDSSTISLYLMTNRDTYVPCTAVYINYDIDAAIVEIRDTDVNEWGPPLVIGDSNKAMPGDQIVTVGAPEGVTAIANVGYLASKEKHIPELINNVLFLSIEVHPGSSGGPIANMRGEIIGIVRGSHGGGTPYDTGLNYGVPSNAIKSWLQVRLQL